VEELTYKIRNCTKCNLCKNTTQAVPGNGNLKSKIFFIAEALYPIDMYLIKISETITKLNQVPANKGEL